MTTDPATTNPSPRITLFTVGFTGKSANEFFELLKQSGVRRVVDIRLNNVSQLAGFTRKSRFGLLLARYCGY